jgi:hypothetical protein
VTTQEQATWQKQEQYQEAIHNATELLREAVMTAKQAIADNLQPMSSSQIQSDVGGGEMPSVVPAASIVDEAFHKAKSILDEASRQFTDDSNPPVPEASPPQVPQMPAIIPLPELLQVQTPDPAPAAASADDLLAMNLHWMDASMRQLVDSMRLQSVSVPAAQHPLSESAIQ